MSAREVAIGVALLVLAVCVVVAAATGDWTVAVTSALSLLLAGYNVRAWQKRTRAHTRRRSS